jgi:uncharacterized protein (DUF433 family)
LALSWRMDALLDRMTSAEIVEEYPYLEADDVRAALAYAAARRRRLSNRS